MKRTGRSKPADLTSPTATLDDVPDREQRRWNTTGPRVEGSVSAARVLGNDGHTWPSWAAWALVYGRLRDEWLSKHERLHRSFPPASERLYAVWQDGGDVDAAQTRLIAERDVDPRLTAVAD